MIVDIVRSERLLIRPVLTAVPCGMPAPNLQRTSMQRLQPSERYLNEMLCIGLSENGVYHVYPYTHHFSILDHFSTENVDDPLELLDN